MPNLTQLFDMQKLIENPDLKSVIEDTHGRYNNVMELDDDMLEYAVAGMGESSDNLIRVSCSRCDNIFMVNKFKEKHVCPNCGNLL